MNSFTFAHVYYPLSVMLITTILSIVGLIKITSRFPNKWVKFIFRYGSIAVILFLVSSSIVLLFISN